MPQDVALATGAPSGSTTPTEPEGQSEQGAGPAAEQTQANKPSRAIDPSTALQAEFTRSQQRWHELRRELGLPKDATPEDVLAAIRVARSAPDDVDDDPVAVPDRKALEAEARAEAAEWRYQAAVFPRTADAAREFAEFARTERDPEQLTIRFYEILQRFAEQTESAAPEAGAPDAPAASEAPNPRDFEVGEGDPSAASSNAAALERLRGSGRVAEGLAMIPGLGRIIGREA